MTTPKLYPLNDCALLVTVRVVNNAGRYVPLEASVAPTAFLATSNEPTATAADLSLVTTPVYTGASGRWLVAFDAADLTPSLLATLFGSTTPFCIVQFTDDVRVAIELDYEAVHAVAPSS